MRTLYVTDLDGTLLDTHDRISPADRKGPALYLCDGQVPGISIGGHKRVAYDNAGGGV